MSDDLTKLAAQADRFVKAKQFDKAEQIYRKICGISKTDPNAWLALGSISANIRHFNEAEDAFRKADSLKPNDRQIQEYLAQTLEIQGKPEDAIELYENMYARFQVIDYSLKIGSLLAGQKRFQDSISWFRKYLDGNDSLAYAHHCIAAAYEAIDDTEKAKTHYLSAIGIEPDSFQLHCNYGVLLQKTGDYQGALSSYTRSTELNQQYPFSHYNLGSVHHALGHYDQAVDHYQQAIQLQNEFPDAYVGLGKSVRSLGNSDSAIKCFRKAIELDENNIAAQINLGRLLVTRGKNDEALALYEHARSLDADNIEVRCSIASIYERNGEFDRAREILDELVVSDPDNKDVAMAFAALSKNIGEEARATELLQVAMKNSSLPPSEHSDILYAQGKLYDDLTQYDQAFACFEEANRLMPYNFRLDESNRQVDELIDTFSADNMATYPRNDSSLSHRPIFIVGMPRSGTTLIEQILASHHGVYGAGELPHLANLTTSLGIRTDSTEPFPENVHLITADIAKQMAEDYIHLASIDCSTESCFTDKMPHNFSLIGLIELLFPAARIIHCTRNPLDTCLSIYTYNFVSSHPYAANLTDLANYYTDYYLRLMKHWQQTTKIEILEVSYESLIDDQERITREILEYCALDWDDNCLSFHENKRNISTISYSQARQPIYNKARGRWKNYRAHLQPLIDHFAIE